MTIQKHDGSTGPEVAQAFAAKLALTVGSARSTGTAYFMHGVKIAAWVNPTHVNMNWGGYPNSVTQRHLTMLFAAFNLPTIGEPRLKRKYAKINPSANFSVVVG